MPHILSDEEYRNLQAYKATGLTPNQIMKLIPEDAPAPMNLHEGEENDGNFEGTV